MQKKVRRLLSTCKLLAVTYAPVAGKRTLVKYFNRYALLWIQKANKHISFDKRIVTILVCSGYGLVQIANCWKRLQD